VGCRGCSGAGGVVCREESGRRASGQERTLREPNGSPHVVDEIGEPDLHRRSRAHDEAHRPFLARNTCSTAVRTFDLAPFAGRRSPAWAGRGLDGCARRSLCWRGASRSPSSDRRSRPRRRSPSFSSRSGLATVHAACFGSGCCRRGRPMLRSLCSEDAQCAAGDEVTLDVERIVDGGMSGKEALR
jgi:hypothetical protein